MELTSTQIAALVGKTERTVQRWIRDGKIKASTTPGGRIQISEEELQALADQNAQAEEIADLRNRVEQLERRVFELERQTVAPPTVKIPRPVLTEYQSTTTAELPASIIDGNSAGSMTARRFAELHNISRDKMAGWIERGQIQATAVPFGQRTQYQLMPEQQCLVIAFWTENDIRSLARIPSQGSHMSP